MIVLSSREYSAAGEASVYAATQHE